MSVGSDDEFGMIPKVNQSNQGPKEVAGHTQSVSIGGGQFEDSDSD